MLLEHLKLMIPPKLTQKRFQYLNHINKRFFTKFEDTIKILHLWESKSRTNFCYLDTELYCTVLLLHTASLGLVGSIVFIR